MSALACACLASTGARAQHTVTFDVAAPGETKAITEWGADTAWPSSDNMRQNVTHMGLDQIDVVRVNFYADEALQADGTLGPRSKQRLDAQLALAAMCGDKPLALTPDTADTADPSYLNGSQVKTAAWVQLLEATAAYLNKPIHAIEPFNEPDFYPWQGTSQTLHDVLTTLAADAHFPGVALQGASTLSSDLAQSWYDVISGPATHGTTHQLGGSADSFANFIQHVQAAGDVAYQPELHSLAEALYGAQYGLGGGIWWGAVQRARGLFVHACQGKQLGYGEDRARSSAAAVYRAPDGRVRGYAGCFERAGTLTPYRFISQGRDVYFNGVGPIREYTLSVTQGQDAYVDIQDENAMPALDGRRWQIVHVQSGLSMQVQGDSVDDGGDIRVGVDMGADNQRWDVARTRDGYFTFTGAHSGKTAEVADWSLDNGANIRQWGDAANQLSFWFIDDAGEGAYTIRNAQTDRYMTSDGSDIYQWDAQNSDAQRWKFVLAQPAASGTLVAHYAFDGDARDSAGTNDGSALGGPGYAAGKLAQALVLDGVDDRVALPRGIASSKDLTVAAWVYWNGGPGWQRIFDFGNSTTQYLFLTPGSGDATLRFAIKNGGDEEILDTDPLPTKQWVHLAVTLEGNTGLLYVDGQPRVAAQILTNPSDLQPAQNFVGQSQFAVDPLFNGMVDDLRIYDYALAAQAIATLHDPSANVAVDASVPAGITSLDGGVEAGAEPPAVELRRSPACALVAGSESDGAVEWAFALAALLAARRRLRRGPQARMSSSC